MYQNVLHQMLSMTIILSVNGDAITQYVIRDYNKDSYQGKACNSKAQSYPDAKIPDRCVCYFGQIYLNECLPKKQALASAGCAQYKLMNSTMIQKRNAIWNLEKITTITQIDAWNHARVDGTGFWDSSWNSTLHFLFITVPHKNIIIQKSKLNLQGLLLRVWTKYKKENVCYLLAFTGQAIHPLNKDIFSYPLKKPTKTPKKNDEDDYKETVIGSSLAITILLFVLIMLGKLYRFKKTRTGSFQTNSITERGHQFGNNSNKGNTYCYRPENVYKDLQDYAGDPNTYYKALHTTQNQDGIRMYHELCENHTVPVQPGIQNNATTIQAKESEPTNFSMPLYEEIDDIIVQAKEIGKQLDNGQSINETENMGPSKNVPERESDVPTDLNDTCDTEKLEPPEYHEIDYENDLDNESSENQNINNENISNEKRGDENIEKRNIEKESTNTEDNVELMNEDNESGKTLQGCCNTKEKETCDVGLSINTDEEKELHVNKTSEISNHETETEIDTPIYHELQDESM